MSEARSTRHDDPAPLIWALRACLAVSALGLAGMAWNIAAGLAPAALPEPPEGFRRFVLVLVSGAIGYGTNWLAIKMLFRPYKPKPWIPFWPQGLLPREQERFARALGQVAAERLMSPEAIAESLAEERLSGPLALEVRRTAEAVLADPATRRLLADAAGASLRAEGPAVAQALRPLLRSRLQNLFDEQFTSERVTALIDGALTRFHESDELRTAFASWVVREASSDGIVDRLMDVLREQFFRYRERNPLRGFLAEQFVIDWDGLRTGLVETFQSEETARELSVVLTDLARALAVRVRSEESAPMIAGLRDQFVDRALDWIEGEGLDFLAARAGEFTDSPEGREAVGAALNDLARRLPTALFERGTTRTLRPEFSVHFDALRQRLVEAFPVSEIVERQVLGMDPARVERLVDEAANRELAWIQILGMVVGLAGGILLALAV
jgi:uncharacterized membrane protein YheB (UPF0754 family)